MKSEISGTFGTTRSFIEMFVHKMLSVIVPALLVAAACPCASAPLPDSGAQLDSALVVPPDSAGASRPTVAAQADSAVAARPDSAGGAKADSAVAARGDTVVTPPGPYDKVWQLDRIAAIVNDSVILMSEVQEQTYFYANQEGISLADSSAFAKARKDVLERLIEEKVIVDEARKRGMTVSGEDVERAVDGVVQDMIRGTGSEEAFRAQLKREGLTEEELRDLYRPRLEAQILASRLVRREVSTEADVTDSDVETYYNEHLDEFPERPETVRLSHIYVSVRPDSLAYAQARAAAERIRERALAGEDFAELASQLSADPSARKGGDIGYFKRGQLDPRFEEAVFALKPGEISDVVQTRLGFHVIKLTDLRDGEARASHILIPVTPTLSAVERAQAKIDSIKAALDAGADFAELAKVASEDDETRDFGGDLGYFAVDDLTPDVKKVIMSLKPGVISDVTQAPDGFHIFLMTEYKPKGKFTLEETKQDIREMLRRERLEQGYQTWIDKLKSEAYIDIKRS
jgi:peptidyl-prolyl cis-trans isomerase SurA